MNHSRKSTWNERARERMAELGITQTALAESLGVVRAAVSHYLSGRTEPPLSLFMLICRHLQVSSDWLLFGGTNSPLPLQNESDRLAQQIRGLDSGVRRDIEAYIRVKAAGK
jgi:transcriptional regulator with XRE-family HTH domain